MQDQQPMPDESTNDERLVGGDRRLRPYPNQVLKCPRCDSLNTKFCYYNNYNLSQPRHFCKNCRRYWTKGGVLRNVPVGGGCRKTKRSKLKSETPSSEDRRKQRKLNDNTHSSSESSTVTVSISEPACSSSLPALFSCSNTQLFLNPNPSKSLANSESPFTVDQSLDGCGGLDSIGSFVGLLNAGNTYNATQISPFRLNHQQNELQQHEKMSTAEEMKMKELPAGCDDDQTAGIDLSGSRNNGEDGELTALNWEGSQGLFDLTQEYWSQSQWTGPNQHIYLP